jgi:hypothetical protein
VLARDENRKLAYIMNNVLNDNKDLANRLFRIEQYILDGNESVHTHRVHSANLDDEEYFADVNGPGADLRRSTITGEPSTQDSSFEQDLKSSRPYRKAIRETMDYSVRSSVAGSHAWTALSDTSLSGISSIAVIRLPIVSLEISNPQHYAFGGTTNFSRKLQPLTFPLPGNTTMTPLSHAGTLSPGMPTEDQLLAAVEADPTSEPRSLPLAFPLAPDTSAAPFHFSEPPQLRTRSPGAPNGTQLVGDATRTSGSVAPKTAPSAGAQPRTQDYSDKTRYIREYKLVLCGGGGCDRSTLCTQVSYFLKEQAKVVN